MIVFKENSIVIYTGFSKSIVPRLDIQIDYYFNRDGPPNTWVFLYNCSAEKRLIKSKINVDNMISKVLILICKFFIKQIKMEVANAIDN